MPAAHGMFDEEDMRGDDDDEADVVEEGDVSGSEGEDDEGEEFHILVCVIR